MLNLYVTSSKLKAGKTFITAGLAATMQSLGYSTSVYKPIQTAGIENNGFMQSPDLTFIKAVDPYIKSHFTYLYKADTEPMIASEEENEIIDINFMQKEYAKIVSTSDCTLIDGDRGLLSPIAPNTQNIDLVRALKIPILIVTQPDNDAVNSTLMTIKSALEMGITISGVIVNNIESDCPKNLLSSIPRVIEEYTNVSVLGLVQHLEGKYSPEDMISAILNGIDIESIFGVRIEKLDMN